jgi:hypothetical protein
VWSSGQEHAAPAAAEESETTSVAGPVTPGRATAKLPPNEVVKFRSIVQDTLGKVQAGDQAGAKARIKDLETAWDDDQATLQAKDDATWTALDGQIDSALKAVRASSPNPTNEIQALTTLLNSLT